MTSDFPTILAAIREKVRQQVTNIKAGNLLDFKLPAFISFRFGGGKWI
ncbi:MAG TPA: hypothetical protein V6D28_08105 [Leptolyngbyaceae cyanobacterium]